MIAICGSQGPERTAATEHPRLYFTAGAAAPKKGGHDQDHETVVLEPAYGQINYYSPVMLGLARFYRQPLFQYLALWDRTAGSRPVFADHDRWGNRLAEVANVTLKDDGQVAVLTCQGAPDSGFTSETLFLARPGRLTLTRETAAEQTWWCHDLPAREGNVLRRDDGTTLRVKRGVIVSFDPAAYNDEKVVGGGKLRLKDPLPMSYPLLKARPSDGRLIIEVSQGGGPSRKVDSIKFISGHVGMP